MNSYRALLLELSNSLTYSDLEGLKFLCRDVIPAGRAEKITRPYEFFSALEHLNMLSEENRDFLASKLILINRNDLRNKLLGIQGDQNGPQLGQGTITSPVLAPGPTGVYSGIVPDALVHDLVEDLSTSWRMLARRLGLAEGVIKNIDSEHRRVIEKGVAMFEEWKQRKTTAATMDALRVGLELIGRRDLSEKVRDFALREQQGQITAAVEHEQRQNETVEERQPFPNLNALLPALRDSYPLPTGTQRQPEEQVDPRPLAAPIVSPSLSMPAGASGPWISNLRDPAHQNPAAASGYWGPPNTIPAVEQSHGDPARQRPAATSGRWDPPNMMPTAASSLRDPAHQIPPAASTLPFSVPISQAAREEPSLQMPDTAAPTLANPSLPYPVPISQAIREEPSLSMPAPATPVLSSPSPIDVNNPSTDAIHASPEANTRPGQSAAAGFTGQDITDHGANNNARTSVPVESAPRSQLMSDGSFLDPDKYEAVKSLGCGGFAKVYLCISKQTGKRMAVKMCDLGMNHRETQNQTEAVKTEVKVLSAVKHKYIVEFFHSEESHNTFLLFLEYMEGGSIEELLRQKGPIEEPLVRKFTNQILTGVDFLHNKGIIHKDIKGGNVLLDEHQRNIKLADFGISTIMNKLKTVTGGRMTKNIVASFFWTSPELLSNKPYGRKTDIWSVGCTVVEMLTTKPPLVGLEMTTAMYKIVHIQVEPPPDCSSIAFGFLKQCLSACDVRPSAAELLEKDPFVDLTQ